MWNFWPTSQEARAIKLRIERLESSLVSLMIKVRKMAQGQAHFEQSFTNLQKTVTDVGQALAKKLDDLVSAHDAQDNESWEAHAHDLDALINQVQNLGLGVNQATTAGASPQTTSGASTGDLPQNHGPTEETPPPPTPPS